MKKILILSAVLAGLGGYLLFPSTAKEHYYSAYLPADTIFSVQILDLKKLSHTFPQSALGHFLSVDSMQEILAELGLDQNAVEQYQELHEGLGDILTNPFIQHIFGDDAVFALLPPDPQELLQDPLQALHRSLMILGTSRTAKGIDFFARLLLREDFTQEHLAGLKMTRIRLDEEEALYVYLDGGIVLLAAYPEVLLAAVQRKAGDRSQHLGQQEDFLAAQRFWSDFSDSSHHAQAHLQVQPLEQVVQHLRQGAGLARLLEEYSSLSGLVLAQQEDWQVQAQGRYHLALTQDNPQQNQFLGLLREEIPLYLWFADLDAPLLTALWPRGSHPQDLAAALGPQLALVLQEIVHLGLFPLPRLLLTAEVRHFPKAQELLHELQEYLNAAYTQQELEFEGHTIHSWRLLPPELTHPALALSDTILYAANGSSTIQAALEDKQEGLAPDFVQQLARANYASLVLRPALLATELEKAQTWLALMVASGSRLRVEKSQVALGQLMQSFDLIVASLHKERDLLELSLTLRHVND